MKIKGLKYGVELKFYGDWMYRECIFIINNDMYLFYFGLKRDYIVFEGLNIKDLVYIKWNEINYVIVFVFWLIY